MRIMEPANEPLAERPYRHDGWTPERKARFLKSLAERDDVRRACSIAGMSRQAAYKLRKRDPLFAEAWTVGLRLGRAARAKAIEAGLSRRARGTLSVLSEVSTSLPRASRDGGMPGGIASPQPKVTPSAPV
jgi:hypothetical protein